MKRLFLLLIPALLFLASCDDDDEVTTGDLNLNISGLADLGTDYVYEGWIIVDGAAVTTGTFSVDASGNLSETAFTLDAAQLNSATAFVLTIEPAVDSDPNPSDVHILAGDFSSSSASLTVGHGSALGDDFTSSTGDYILATPTDGNSDMDENSGVWWLNNSTGSAVAGLSLPTLPAGWAYEGWAVIGGTPYSTGTFTSVSGSDDSAPFSGTAAAGPAYPGEDFLMNAPTGVTFPTDLAGMTVVVSVEPVPDNSTSPFLLKPLLGSVPASATDHTVYNMSNNATATNPTGTASR